MIPKTSKFEVLLNSFRVTKPDVAGNWREFVAVPRKSLSNNFEIESAFAVTFWYRDDTGISMESFLIKIIEEAEAHLEP